MIADLINGLKNLISDVVDWFVEWCSELLNLMLTPIVGMLPDSFTLDCTAFVQYMSWANRWIALDYCFVLLFAYFAIVSIIISINWILGLIPTIN